MLWSVISSEFTWLKARLSTSTPLPRGSAKQGAAISPHNTQPQWSLCTQNSYDSKSAGFTIARNVKKERNANKVTKADLGLQLNLF